MKLLFNELKISKINIALSDLIMLMGTWQNPLPEIIQRFNKPDQINTLMEFLTVLPEEVIWNLIH